MERGCRDGRRRRMRRGGRPSRRLSTRMPISACCAAAAAAVVEHTSSTMRDTLSCERRRVPTTRTTTGAVDCCYCNNEGRWNAGGGDASLLPTIISMPAGIRMYPDNLSEPRTDQQVRLQPLHSLRGAGGTCANYPDFSRISVSCFIYWVTAFRPILTAYQNFLPFFYFIAEMAKNRVLVSLDACSLPNQILTCSISFIIPINSCST